MTDQTPAATEEKPAPLPRRRPGKSLPALVPAAAARTEDAPAPATVSAESTPEAAVAVLEPPVELPKRFATIGELVASRYPGASGTAPAIGLPAGAIFTDKMRARSDEDFASSRTAAVATMDEIDGSLPMRRERVLGPLDAWLHARPRPVPAAAPVAAVSHEGTGPHPWLDTMALELAPDTDAMTLDPDYDGCADGEPRTGRWPDGR